MTKKDLLEMANKYLNDKPTYKAVYYKRNGRMIRRNCDEIVYSDEHKKAYTEIKKYKVFKCAECGKKCDFFELEYWACDFKKDNCICAECYEKAQGEDL